MIKPRESTQLDHTKKASSVKPKAIDAKEDAIVINSEIRLGYLEENFNATVHTEPSDSLPSFLSSLGRIKCLTGHPFDEDVTARKEFKWHIG
jgi:hypothetical protein